MPEGWLLAILVLAGALLLQIVLVVVQHRVRDALRRRQGRPSLAQERAEAEQRTGDPRLQPLGTRLPGGRVPPEQRRRRPPRDGAR